MKPTLLTIALLLWSAHSSFAQQTGACEGHRQDHDLGTEIFSTSSRVIKQGGVVVYETCVENKGTRDLWVNWKIPGPVSYVPRGRMVNSQRVFLTEQSISAVSCLEYGSLAKIMQETYLGHEDDREKLSREQKEGCRYSPSDTLSQSRSNSFEVATFKVRLFVPSDRERPEDTMLEFIADVGASYAKGLPTGQTVSYKVQPLAGRKGGNPEVMSIRLASEAAMKNWASVSETGLIKGGAQLGAEKKINLMLDAGPSSILKNVRYEIFDEHQKQVGAFDAPVWVDARDR